MGIMYFSAQPIPEVIEFINKHYKGGSVLDYGCGTGRYTKCFKSASYVGVDGHKGNIGACRDLFPDYHFELHDLETWKPKKKFDYLFSSVAMEQVKNLPKDWAKTYILIEPTTEGCHDYAGIYKPKINEPMNASHEGIRMMIC